MITLSQWIDRAIKRALEFPLSNDFWQGYYFAITELRGFLESRQDNDTTG